MKHIIQYLLCLVSLVLASSCEQEFERDNQPLVLFNTTEYPQIKGFLVEHQPLTSQTLILAYRNGGNRTVSISLSKQFGIYAEEQIVALAEDGGTVELPLKGVAPDAGLTTLKIKISYDIYHIFCEATTGVRPEVMGEIELTTPPQLNGFLYQNLAASSCFVTLDYKNGWGRTLTARFTCEDAGISTESKLIRLAADDQSGTLEIPLQGTPETSSKVDIHLFLLKEGETEETEYTFADVEIMKPTPYEPATVSHTIITTDRNELMSNGGIAQTATFTYNTLFVDMNGDGYVSGNYEIWLDRNVGATSTDANSKESYGFLYQPGRDAPGWVSASQTGNPNTHYPNETFKLNNANWFNGTSSPITLATPTGGVSTVIVGAGKIGPNNPCPQGYRLPNQDEWKKLQEFLTKENGSYKDGIVALPFAGGYLNNANVTHTGIGTNGSYWASPFDNNQVPGIFFSGNLSTTTIANRVKGMGLSVRCLKAKESELSTSTQD